MTLEQRYLWASSALMAAIMIVFALSVPIGFLFQNEPTSYNRAQMLFQSQIDSCRTNSPCNVILPPGIFVLNDLSPSAAALLLIDDKTNLRLVGAGINETSLLANTDAQATGIRIIHSRNITITGITISALPPGQSQTSITTGISIEGSANVTLSNVEILDAAIGISIGSSSPLQSPSSNVTIETSSVHRMLNQGIKIGTDMSPSFDERVLVRGTKIFDGGNVGIDVGEASSVTLENNTIRGFDIGIRVGSYDYLGGSTNVSIASNSIAFSKCYGILVNKAANLSILLNLLSDNALQDCFSQPTALLVYSFLDTNHTYHTSNITISYNTYGDDQSHPTQRIGIIAKEDGDQAISNIFVTNNLYDERILQPVCTNVPTLPGSSLNQCPTS